ncbi:hypothetical protein V1511DRAFT_487248 [Dipodascopsis uninucleata]
MTSLPQEDVSSSSQHSAQYQSEQQHEPQIATDHVSGSKSLRPAYVSMEAVAAIMTSDKLMTQCMVTLGPIPPSIIDALNGFLDYFVFTLLGRARSALLDPLRQTVRLVLKNQLGLEAVAEGEAELRMYIRTPEEEYALLGPSSLSSVTKFPANPRFDIEYAWSMARIRCMVYSSLGNIEEADVIDFVPDQRNLFLSSNFEMDDQIISPICTIFLTAVLEHIVGYVIRVATHAAFSRFLVTAAAHHPGPRILDVIDSDVEKVEHDPLIGKLWRQWKKRGPLTERYHHKYKMSTSKSPSSSSESGLLGLIPELKSANSPSDTTKHDEQHQITSPVIVDHAFITPQPSPLTEFSYEDFHSYEDDDERDDGEDYREFPSNEQIIPDVDILARAKLSEARMSATVPVTRESVYSRRQSRPWSYHGQRFSRYSVTSMNRPFSVTERLMDKCGRQSVPMDRSHSSMSSASHKVEDAIVRASSPGVTGDNAITECGAERSDFIANQSNGTVEGSSDLVTNAVSDNAPYHEDEYECEEDVDDDSNDADTEPSSTTSPTSPYQTEFGASTMLLASVPLDRKISYNAQEGLRNDDTSLKRHTSAFSSMMRKTRGQQGTGTELGPDILYSVPSEKVRKYIWISCQRSENDIQSLSPENYSNGEFERVTFERLLNSNVTFKVDLTPDKLREAKPLNEVIISGLNSPSDSSDESLKVKSSLDKEKRPVEALSKQPSSSYFSSLTEPHRSSPADKGEPSIGISQRTSYTLVPQQMTVHKREPRDATIKELNTTYPQELIDFLNQPNAVIVKEDSSVTKPGGSVTEQSALKSQSSSRNIREIFGKKTGSDTISITSSLLSSSASMTSGKKKLTTKASMVSLNNNLHDLNSTLTNVSSKSPRSSTSSSIDPKKRIPILNSLAPRDEIGLTSRSGSKNDLVAFLNSTGPTGRDYTLSESLNVDGENTIADGNIKSTATGPIRLLKKKSLKLISRLKSEHRDSNERKVKIISDSKESIPPLPRDLNLPQHLNEISNSSNFM